MAARGDRDRPVAIVTGASSGIGRALAVQLGAAGFHLGLIARRSSELEATASTIDSAGGTAVVAAADVGDRDALRSAFDSISAQLGPIDVAVANAGFGTPTRLHPLNTADVERPMALIAWLSAWLPDALVAQFMSRPGDEQPGFRPPKAAVDCRRWILTTILSRGRR